MPTVLTEQEWQERAARHARRLDPLLRPHQERQQRREKHPVYDFLFQYYGFPPKRLRQWHPGQGIVLLGEAARSYLAEGHYREDAGGVVLRAADFPAHRLQALRWVVDLLTQTAGRPARIGCLGLHEWAMVYRIPEARHSQLPLRMQPEELAVFVESQRIVCTHHDAFRFFTPAARPLNTVQPSRERIHELEQGGCLHANMDLYKWAHKFFPWIGSDLVADALLLAAEIRELDMRGSPYDCAALGFDAIPMETAEGRHVYSDLQRALAERAVPLRQRLISELGILLAEAGAGAVPEKKNGDG